MKKLMKLIMINILILIEGCSFIGLGVRNSVPEEPENSRLLQNNAFEAKKNSLVRIKFKDQQIEGLLMGMKADSVLIKNVTTSSNTLDHSIPISTIHHIRVLRISKLVEYLGYGLLIGVGTGLIASQIIRFSPNIVVSYKELVFRCTLLGGGSGTIIGGLVSLLKGMDLNYNLIDKSYHQKVEVIRRLSGCKDERDVS